MKTPVASVYSLLLAALLLIISFNALALPQNRVLSLDGQGDYVQLPADMFNTLDEATVEAWVRWRDFQYFSQPLGFGKDGHTLAVNNDLTTNTLQFFIYDAHVKLHLIQQPDFLRLNRWYHIACTTGPGGMKLYVDGQLVGEDEFTGSFSSIGSGGPNALGRSPWKYNTIWTSRCTHFTSAESRGSAASKWGIGVLG